MAQPPGTVRFYPYTGLETWTTEGYATASFSPTQGNGNVYWFGMTVAFSGSNEQFDFWNPQTQEVTSEGIGFLNGDTRYVSGGLEPGTWDLYTSDSIYPLLNVKFNIPNPGFQTYTISYNEPDTWLIDETFIGTPVSGVDYVMKALPAGLAMPTSIYVLCFCTRYENPPGEQALELTCGKITLYSSGAEPMLMMTQMSSEESTSVIRSVKESEWWQGVVARIFGGGLPSPQPPVTPPTDPSTGPESPTPPDVTPPAEPLDPPAAPPIEPDPTSNPTQVPPYTIMDVSPSGTLLQFPPGTVGSFVIPYTQNGVPGTISVNLVHNNSLDESGAPVGITYLVPGIQFDLPTQTGDNSSSPATDPVDLPPSTPTDTLTDPTDQPVDQGLILVQNIMASGKIGTIYVADSGYNRMYQLIEFQHQSPANMLGMSSIGSNLIQTDTQGLWWYGVLEDRDNDGFFETIISNPDQSGMGGIIETYPTELVGLYVLQVPPGTRVVEPNIFSAITPEGIIQVSMHSIVGVADMYFAIMKTSNKFMSAEVPAGMFTTTPTN